MSEEEWRDIPGYEGFYQASTLGRIRSLDRMVRAWNHHRRHLGRVLSASPDAGGYLVVGLSKEGHVRTYTVHILVCSAFHGPCPEVEPPMECAHWDNNRKNNRPENLRWATRAENNGPDKERHGTVIRGSQHHKTTLTETQVVEIFCAGGRHREIAARYGIRQSTVGRIKRGHTWRHVTEGLTLGPKHKKVLTEAQVIEIFYAEGLQREIAAQFGVNQPRVSSIKRGASWGRVTGKLPKRPSSATREIP